MTPARFTRLPGKRSFDITDVIASGRGYRPIGGRETGTIRFMAAVTHRVPSDKSP